ncbi:MAG: sulfatase [Planctomycetota bacterium]|nr:sulfatase [Planctomycetota bacterium]
MLKQLIAAGMTCFVGLSIGLGAEPTRPHVLFIAVDDLRPQLGCYGQSQMQTPNFDALAARSVLFERAFCMVPTCGASRASLLSGIRPAPRRFVSHTARADEDVPHATTLNTHFKNNGYTTISLGKVFHFPADNLEGWSEKPWRPSGSGYQNTALQEEAMAEHRAKYPGRTKVRGMAYEAFDAPDEAYPDHETASKAIAYLEQFADQDEPFFLAVGFQKPHLPFCAPQSYWDLYDADKIELPANSGPPTDAPEGAVHTSGELRAYSGIPPEGPVSDETARNLIHGYYACVSFIDAQLGRLMTQLEASGLAENTIVVIWGDHGWQLGEHGMWNKHSCFETSMHAPLMIAAPGIAAGRTASLTEFIDIYPTLCDLSSLEKPEHLEGVSLMPWLNDPATPGKLLAVGRFGPGDTIRTDFFRYSEYRKNHGAGDLTGTMLYDHRSDPGENQNVVAKPAYADDASALSRDLNRVTGRNSKEREKATSSRP